MKKSFIIAVMAVFMASVAGNVCLADTVSQADAANASGSFEKELQNAPSVPEHFAPRQGDDLETPPPPPRCKCKNSNCECKNRHFEGKRPDKAEMEAKKAEFEKRLKLTDAQKKQIEDNRKQDIEKAKPVFDEIDKKKALLRKIEEDKSLTRENKELQSAEARKEINDLRAKLKTAHEQNMKSFESLLTKKQKKEFEKIKKEQKKKMEKCHKQCAKDGKNNKIPDMPPRAPQYFDNPPELQK